jgi:hypothetical protein
MHRKKRTKKFVARQWRRPRRPSFGQLTCQERRNAVYQWYQWSLLHVSEVLQSDLLQLTQSDSTNAIGAVWGSLKRLETGMDEVEESEVEGSEVEVREVEGSEVEVREVERESEFTFPVFWIAGFQAGFGPLLVR